MLDDLTFLRVISANPDDDGPRLLYADYLERKATRRAARMPSLSACSVL